MEKKHYQTVGRAKLADYLKRTADLPPRSAEDIYSGLLTACTADGGTVRTLSRTYPRPRQKEPCVLCAAVQPAAGDSPGKNESNGGKRQKDRKGIADNPKQSL